MTNENQNQKKDFEKYVDEAMNEIVKTHNHDHPLYQPTRIEKNIIDNNNKIAAFVLFEQIDTDRLTPEGEGWLGDQFRYSVWFVEEGKKPVQLYEDHAYIRNTKSALTNSRGRDARIGLEKIVKDGVIATITPKDAESAYGDLSQVKVKISLDGKIEEPEDFMDQAKNLVKSIGPKLGYDYLKDNKQLSGENVAVLVWGTENGSTYGYDTVYLVWKDKNGKLNHREITDSRCSKAYLSADIKGKGKDIIVDVKGNEYEFSRKELDLKGKEKRK